MIDLRPFTHFALTDRQKVVLCDRVLAHAWDEEKHPRHPSGSERGGEFAPSEGTDQPKTLGAEHEFLLKDLSDYQLPEITHEVLRGRGEWGASHSGSSMISGESADLMGIEGYRTDQWPENRKHFGRIARDMLERIHADAPGSEEKLYHSFENTRRIRWKVGDTMRLPLTASSGDIGVYGLRSDPREQQGKPTVLVFPKGTQMVGYGKWKPSDAREFGHVWSEAIVAGGFKVTKVSRAIDPYHWQVDNSKGTAIHPEWDVVYVEQTETFNPATKRWSRR